MVDIVQQVSTDIVLSDKSEAEAGTNNTKFMTPLRTKEAIDKNLVPFNAMSQSQFEAIRAANNEEFAASGFVHFGGQYHDNSNVFAINQGLWTNMLVPNILYAGRGDSESSTGVSKSKFPIINIAGVIFNVKYVNYGAGDGRNIIKFPSAPDGKTTYNKSTGAIVTHVDSTTAFAAQQADPTNVEVVTDRVDMWGFESWLEEVNATNPFVYPNGLIQSQATTMDGINTSASARPVTYYAVFDGDTRSKGKGVNFFTLTDAQKKKVLGNHKNNLYYLDDGRLVQWRLRQRTFAGAGNGDWINIDATASANSGQLSFSIKHVIKTHGAQNTAKPNDAASDGYQLLNQTSTNWLDGSGLGIWARHKSVATQSVNGELFFLVCGTVNRLNSGAYHPSFNPSGAKFWINTTNGGGAYWYVSGAGNNNVSTALCFNQVEAGTTGVVGARNQSGYIGDSSARPDGRFYDAIYADGQGGVCRDMRYSAYGLTPTDFADADHRVKNGTYRGFESQFFTKILNEKPQNTSNPTSEALFVNDPSIYKIGDYVSIFQNGVVECSQCRINAISGSVVSWLKVYGTFNRQAGVSPTVIHSAQLPSSVGGSFLQTDIIGSPERILATPQLANGWQGSWINPAGYPAILSRKAISAPTTLVLFGATWSSVTNAFDSTKNSVHNHVVGDGALVAMHTYQAFAKQTENAVSGEVYGGAGGVGNVCFVRISDVLGGCLLQESLIHKVNTDNTAWTTESTLQRIGISAKGKFAPFSGYESAHNELFFLHIPPNNGSGAIKALNYNVNINQQAFIQYAYTELKHNGTNWGDDSKVTIVDNQSTKTDLNGNTVLVGTAQTCESLGWIKNKL